MPRASTLPVFSRNPRDDNRFVVKMPSAGRFSASGVVAKLVIIGTRSARAAPGNDHGSIVTAIQDQPGLWLESERVSVEVIVVDKLEKPWPN